MTHHCQKKNKIKKEINGNKSREPKQANEAKTLSGILSAELEQLLEALSFSGGKVKQGQSSIYQICLVEEKVKGE